MNEERRPAPPGGRLRVVILLHYDLQHEPRARRQAAALVAAGHEVAVVGATGSAAAARDLRVVEVRPQPLHDPGRWAIAARQGLLGRLSPHAAYWADPANHRFRRALQALPADLVIAHDWSTLPIALSVARRSGARVLYDSHEYAVAQGAGRWRWRLLFPHMVRAIEGRAIRQVDGVTTVSEGIADQLVTDHGLTTRPTVVRSTPVWQAHGLRPTGTRVEVLYHGLLNESRGLEALVDSVARWAPDRHLVLRGPGRASYVEGLRRRAEQVAPGRVRIDPPVPPERIVDAASASDIGVFVGDPAMGQLRFALPNKVFEYAMAGLAVLTTPLPEILLLNAVHDLALTTRDATPSAIAQAVNALSHVAIDQRKAAALAAAGELCWDVEQVKFLRAVKRATTPGASG